MKLTHFAVAGLVLLLGAGIYIVMQEDMDGKLKEQQADFNRKIEQMNRTMKEQQESAAALAKAADDLKERAATGVKDTKAAMGKTASKAERAIDRAVNETTGEVKEATDELGEKMKGLARSLENRDPREDSVLTPVPRNNAAAEEELPGELMEKERDILNSTGVGADRIAQETASATGELEDNSQKRTRMQSMIAAQPAIARIKNAEKAEESGFVVLDRGLDANLAKGDTFAVRRGTWVIGRVAIGDTVRDNESVADVVRVDARGMALQKGDELIKFDQ